MAFVVSGAVDVLVDDLDDVAACARHGWDLVGRPQTGVQGPLAGSRFAYCATVTDQSSNSSINP
jgi:hypothetical protein